MPRWLDYRARFWRNTDSSGGEDSCWPWLAAVSGGYGQMRVNNRMMKAHRFAYEMLVALIPSGMEIDHLCHTRDTNCQGGDDCPHRRCVNPKHLEPVTGRVNSLRGQSPAAKQARQTECKNGHPFTPENTYRKSNGGRDCRTCNKARSQRRSTAAVNGVAEEQA